MEVGTVWVAVEGRLVEVNCEVSDAVVVGLGGDPPVPALQDTTIRQDSISIKGMWIFLGAR